MISVGIKAQVINYVSTGDGCGSLLVDFSIEPATVNDTIQSIQWNFDDGTILKGQKTPQHLFNEPGIYRVSALVNSETRLYAAPIPVFSIPRAVFYMHDSVTADSDYNYVVDKGVDTNRFKMLLLNLDMLTKHSKEGSKERLSSIAAETDNENK